MITDDLAVVREALNETLQMRPALKDDALAALDRIEEAWDGQLLVTKEIARTLARTEGRLAGAERVLRAILADRCSNDFGENPCQDIARAYLAPREQEDRDCPHEYDLVRTECVLCGHDPREQG